MEYIVKKGDNLIKIARMFGLNSLDELLDLNKEITDPNLIRIGQSINLPESVEARSNLPASVVTAKAPNYDSVDFNRLPDSVKQQVLAYAQAVKDNAMSLSNVPKLYQQQVYNQGIRNATNEAAPYVAKHVMMAPWTIPDMAVRGTLNEGRKAVKQLTTGDKSEGDYGIQDYFGNFSWLGRDFEQEHPGWDFAINSVTTPLVMVGTEELAARAMDGTLGPAVRSIVQNARPNAEATAEAMGIERMHFPGTAGNETSVRSSGVEYIFNPKNSGKTGTVTKGANTGYKANVSGKGTFKNKSSYVPKQPKTEVYVAQPKPIVTAPPSTGTGHWHGFPIPLPEQSRTNYVITHNEPEVTHIEETVPTNPWIYNRNATETVPYRRGMETPTYISAEAPRGAAIVEQPITRESMKQGVGPVIRKAEEVPGVVTGSTPSGYYSGYGHTYGNEGGPWIVIRQKLGGILKNYNK